MKIIAHRGASHDAPENTVAAVELAWAQGADAVEVDVQRTRDGGLAVIHDPDTQRVAGVRHRLADLTLDEASALDVGRWKHARFAGERLPRLETVMARVPPGRQLLVELKGGPQLVPGLLAAVTSAGPAFLPSQLVVIGFDLAAMRYAKQALPAVEVCWIVDHDATTRALTAEWLVAQCRAAALDGLDLAAGWPIDAAFVRTVHAAGQRLYVWTVDDPPLARQLAAAGVDGIATNRPGWLRPQLAQ